jgi:2-polyprenyl-3-methyl-5-hydroxy-6-metoxy-1,4-benzoquinol methylase
MHKRERAIESAVVNMYSHHPSPSIKDKLTFASHRMELRLRCCGLTQEDYVGKDVLDAGCGTGEYSCWLASKHANVIGIDLSDGSLQEAREYAAAVGLHNLRFEKRSVLETGFPDASFDFVYCTGVLHHTPDPFGGLVELCRVLRPGGKILISLYNSFGFFPREVRRRVAQFLGGADLDRRVLWGRRLFPRTEQRLSQGNRNDPLSALYDYFGIPHETLHSTGQVLDWFDQLGLEYIGSFPPLQLGDYPVMFASKEYKSVERAFQHGLGHRISRFGIMKDMRRQRPGHPLQVLVQMIWLVTGVGVFSMCAQKPPAAKP